MRKTVLASTLAGLTLSASSYGQVYDIEVLPINDLALNSFAQSIDDSGNVTVVTQNLFNQVIDPSLLDFDSLLLTAILTDPDSSQAGNFNDIDFQLIIQAIRSNTASNSSTTQKLASFRSFEYDGQTTTEIPAFDVFSRTIDQITQSNQVVVRDSEAGNFFIGTSDDGYESFEFTSQSNITSQFVLNDFRNLAFVQFGDTVTPLLPPDQTLGGLSDAYSINSSLQVAGSGGSIAATGVTASVSVCEDEDARGDIPESLCLWQLNYPASSDTGILQTSGALLIRPIVWSVDGSGNLVDTEVFRLLDEEEDNTIAGTGEAVDINDGGIAVGYSEFTTREAAMFFNGQTSRILTQGDFLSSDAMAINNNNFVAGTFVDIGDTGAITKMFVTNLESSEVDEPVGFFLTSTTLPRDMNNENIVVGQGVVDVAASDVAQAEAFIYDISTEVFTNLNDLIECNSPYTLINASGINDNGEIAVTARASLPSRNELGEALLDETGAEVLVDASVALKLTPIPNGQPQNCNEQEDDFERQGASIAPLGLLSFIGLIGFRRLRRKWN